MDLVTLRAKAGIAIINPSEVARPQVKLVTNEDTVTGYQVTTFLNEVGDSVALQPRQVISQATGSQALQLCNLAFNSHDLSSTNRTTAYATVLHDESRSFLCLPGYWRLSINTHCSHSRWLRQAMVCHRSRRYVASVPGWRYSVLPGE